MNFKFISTNKNNMDHFGDNIVSFLRNAAIKVEELQVQSALGKSELSDKLEEIKKETRNKIHTVKVDINSAVEVGKENYQDLKAKMEHLEVQLALGKAEAMDEIEKQKKNLSKAIQEVKEIFTKV